MDHVPKDAIVVFATMRNEMVRLPNFFAHYRALGVGHFVIVDNDSDDGTSTYLAEQLDVSVWQTRQSYRLARFGMDWIGWLLWKYGHGRWCLTVDADELLIYPDHEARDLRALTSWLDHRQIPSLGAMMLDLYPKGPLQDIQYTPGDNPMDVLCWYDADNYSHRYHYYYGNLWIQGGVRRRVFFDQEPDRAPTLNKTPLVKWNRRYTYVSSTHQLLPRRLHDVFDPEQQSKVTGILLHTKFLPVIAEKSAEELTRQQHFQNTTAYVAYHQRLAENPDLWCPSSQQFEGASKLIAQGLMSKGDWV